MITLTPFHPRLAAAVSEALSGLLVEHSAREVGRWLGVKGDTVSARGRAVAAWPLTDLGLIAQRFSPVASALRDYVTGTAEIRGEATAAVGDLLRDVAASGSFIAHATEALADGLVTIDEASDLLIEIDKRRELEDRSLIPALTACVREG